MRRDPIVCPGCDVPFEVSPPARTRWQRVPAEPTEVAAPVVATAETEDGAVAPPEDPDVQVAGDDDDVEVEEEAAEAIEDSSELGEDDDDMAEVIEDIEEPEKADV